MALKKGSNLGFLNIYSYSERLNSVELRGLVGIHRKPNYKQTKAKKPKVKLCIVSQTKGSPLIKELKCEVFNWKITEDPRNASLWEGRWYLWKRTITRVPQQNSERTNHLNLCVFHHRPGVSHTVISKQIREEASSYFCPSAVFQYWRRSMLRKEKRVILNKFGI